MQIFVNLTVIIYFVFVCIFQMISIFKFPAYLFSTNFFFVIFFFFIYKQEYGKLGLAIMISQLDLSYSVTNEV